MPLYFINFTIEGVRKKTMFVFDYYPQTTNFWSWNIAFTHRDYHNAKNVFPSLLVEFSCRNYFLHWNKTKTKILCIMVDWYGLRISKNFTKNGWAVQKSNMKFVTDYKRCPRLNGRFNSANKLGSGTFCKSLD